MHKVGYLQAYLSMPFHRLFVHLPDHRFVLCILRSSNNIHYSREEVLVVKSHCKESLFSGSVGHSIHHRYIHSIHYIPIRRLHNSLQVMYYLCLLCQYVVTEIKPEKISGCGQYGRPADITKMFLLENIGS